MRFGWQTSSEYHRDVSHFIKLIYSRRQVSTDRSAQLDMIDSFMMMLLLLFRLRGVSIVIVITLSTLQVQRISICNVIAGSFPKLGPIDQCKTYRAQI